jgi:vancomycin permeability regulator SanA
MIRRLFRLLLQLFILGVVLFIASAVWILTDGLFDQGDEADVALVSGSGIRPDGVPAPNLRERLDGVVKLYQDGKFPLIIVSGPTRGDGFSEAKTMAEYLVAHQVPAAAIILDSGGDDNAAVARGVAKIMQERNIHSVMIVSYYYCITRLQLALKQTNILTVRHSHVGNVRQDDGVPLMHEVFATYHDIVMLILMPGVDQLQKKVKEEAPKVEDTLHQDVEKVQQDLHKHKK